MSCLRRMSTDEFSRWLAQAIPAYAADKALAGHWNEPASLLEARGAFMALLPEGLATAGQHLFTIQDEAGQAVGAIWIAQAEQAAGPTGYIYDLVVWPEHRHQGYARRAMLAVEQVALDLGFGGLALHVFGHNRSAQALYRKLGYEVTDINMFKPVGRAGDTGRPASAPGGDARQLDPPPAGGQLPPGPMP